VAILSFNHPDRSGRPTANEGEEMSIAHSWSDVKRLLVVLAIAVAAMFFAVPGPAKANIGSYCGHGVTGHYHWLPSPVYWSIFWDWSRNYSPHYHYYDISLQGSFGTTGYINDAVKQCPYNGG
jgi:hypothetical protein